MRIAILGASGQLGTDLRSTLAGQDVVPLFRAEVEVSNHAATRSVLEGIRPEVIVNTTAYHRVDDSEDNAELAYSINALAVLNLVRIANDLGAVLVHFSTDYVFDGHSRTPYVESSETLPLNVYGNSKLAGEYLVRSLARDFILVRTCGLYGRAGSRGKGGNFVEAMLNKARRGEAIRVVNDQVLTPTSTADLARQMTKLLGTTERGLFHVTNEGFCSWYEFARAIFEISGIDANLSSTPSELYKTPATRPRYSVLENQHLKDIGLNRMLHWRDALKEYLATTGHLSG